MFLYFFSVKKWGKLHCWFIFHICCMLFIHPFLLSHLRSISNHLDISSIHKARKCCISTSFTTWWKTFIYFILFFWSVYHCKFLSWNSVFLPMQSEVLLQKTRTCAYLCRGDCIGSEVKFRFFCVWFIIKLLFRMSLPCLARPKGEQEDCLRGRDLLV